jgi:hypothetical protein
LTGTIPGGSLVSIALVHYPVYDRNRRVVATAITNLDIHDMARLARTFGLFRFYVVTPVEEQRELAERIRSHWQDGWGGSYNPDRRQALELLRVVPSIGDAVSELGSDGRQAPQLVVTGANYRSGSVSFADMREIIMSDERQFLIVFGTGWGLTDEFFDRAENVLEPVKGFGDYNHLSVRAAAAIILDRLLGRQ